MTLNGSKDYDLLILGAGPAGLAAGIYAARAQLRVGIIDKAAPGGQIATTSEVENYPGFGRGTTGAQVVLALYNHAAEMGAEFLQDEIQQLNLQEPRKELLGNQGAYSAEAVILAPGAEPRLLGIPGEQELRGRGVSYCATCDAGFYRDMQVVVIGSGDAAIEEALYLTGFAQRVTIVVIHDPGKVDANAALFEKAQKNEKIHWIWNSQVVEINGQERVSAITLKDLKQDSISQQDTEGVFILIGTTPKTEFLPAYIHKNTQGYLLTDEKMQTSVEGVYACGDAREKYLRQVVTAVSDGAVAAVAAGQYIRESRFFDQEVLQTSERVIVGYYAPNQPESLTELTQVDQWIKENQVPYKFLRIDISRNDLLKQHYQVETLPMIQIFQNGELQETLTGKLDYAKLKEVVA